jgi:Uma2 family endonuclease
VTQPVVTWTIDPEDPRAPPTDIWQRLTRRAAARDRRGPAERVPRVRSEPARGGHPPGRVHRAARRLRRWFRGRGRSIYIAGNLPIYYPGERMFSPDLIAVDGADQRQRDSWIVDAEGGKGLDVAIEIVVRGDRKKDLEKNVERYAGWAFPSTTCSTGGA